VVGGREDRAKFCAFNGSADYPGAGWNFPADKGSALHKYIVGCVQKVFFAVNRVYNVCQGSRLGFAGPVGGKITWGSVFLLGRFTPQQKYTYRLKQAITLSSQIQYLLNQHAICNTFRACRNDNIAHQRVQSWQRIDFYEVRLAILSRSEIDTPDIKRANGFERSDGKPVELRL